MGDELDGVVQFIAAAVAYTAYTLSLNQKVIKMLRDQGNVQEQKRLKEVKKQMVQARVRLKDVRALNVAAQECVFWTKVCLEALKNGECDTAAIKGGKDRKLGTVKKYDAQLRD